MEAATITVAIVEDRREIRESLQQLLGGEDGFEPGGAWGSMEEALARIGPHPPDVLMVDLGLPGMTGAEGIRLLRARFPQLPMIVLTVFDDDQRIFEALCAGARGYLLKNTPPLKLLEGIREVLEGGAPMSPSIARRVIELFRRFSPTEPGDSGLTPHETRVLKLLAEGHHFKSAGRELGVSANTVGFHVKKIYAKLEVHSKAEAVAKALRHGLFR